MAIAPDSSPAVLDKLCLKAGCSPERKATLQDIVELAV
jgi:hypothetical protein